MITVLLFFFLNCKMERLFVLLNCIIRETLSSLPDTRIVNRCHVQRQPPQNPVYCFAAIDFHWLA